MRKVGVFRRSYGLFNCSRVVFCLFLNCMHSVWANMEGKAKGMDGYENQQTTTTIPSISCIALGKVGQGEI